MMINKLRAAIQNPKLAIAFLKYRAFRAFGHFRFKRFIVLSRSRTGSNMLVSFLNSHPNILVNGEILGTLSGRNYINVLTTAYGKEPYYVKAKGFKIFYYHPSDDTNGNVWDYLVNMKDLYVIHLKRRNILRTLTSRKIAGVLDVWSTKANDSRSDDSARPKKISFTIDELTKGFEQTRQWEQNGDSMFNNHPMASVYYEDLVDDVESCFRNITDFLGVPYMHPQTGLKRQNPEKIRDLVSNYDELKTAFEGTQWQSFFDD
jgi:LPS sulfotransferase NodH